MGQGKRALHIDRVRPSRRREAEGRAKERMRSARHPTPPRGPPAPHHPQRRHAQCGLAGRVVPGKRGNLKGGVGQGAKTRYSSKSRSCLQLPLFVDSPRERMSERAHAAWGNVHGPSYAALLVLRELVIDLIEAPRQTT